MKIQHLLFAVISLLLPLTSQAATLLTSFETAEGFTVGSATNTAGWTIPANATIVNTKHTDGDNSLQISRGTGLAAYTLTLSQLGQNYNSISWDVLTEGFVANTQIGLWQIRYGGDKTESRVELKLTYGATISDPIKLEYASTYAGYTPTYTAVYLSGITGESIDDWNDVSVSFDFTNAKYEILFGGETIANYASLVTGISTPRISHIYLRNGTNATGNPVSYFDNIMLDHVTIVPEPSIAWLLFFPAVFALFRRRVSAKNS